MIGTTNSGKGYDIDSGKVYTIDGEKFYNIERRRTTWMHKFIIR